VEGALKPSPASSGLDVVVILRSCGFPRGMAATNRVRLLGRALREHGVAVRVVCMRVSERPGEVRNTDVCGVADGLAFLYTPGSTVRSSSFAVRRWREARGFVLALREVRRLRAHGRLDCAFLPDVCVERWRPSTFALVWWLRRLGVPVIVELNEAPAMYASRLPRVSSRFSHLYGVDAVLAISAWLSKWAADEASRLHRLVDIVEVPIVVDMEERASGGGAPDARLFVYSASDEYLGDLAFVLRSLRRVWEQAPGARLAVTGIGPQRGLEVAGRERVLDAVADGRLQFRGYVDRPALLQTYRQAAGLLIPLHDDLRSRARFPTKIGEYLASGRPVVTCGVGEIGRFLRDGVSAYVAPADDEAAFAARMLAVLGDEVQAAAIGRAGREVAAHAFAYRAQGPVLHALIVRLARGR
jgi:glycosyltransferase involved in cell wall biosynthesis